MSEKFITVVESTIFHSHSKDIWTESERDEFINFIAANPLSGDEIKGTGGIRKVRWAKRGTGKRGGVRVIYYYHDCDIPIFLLSLYAKNSKENLSAQEKELMRSRIELLKKAIRDKRKG